jgi:hypothetical protein
VKRGLGWIGKSRKLFSALGLTIHLDRPILATQTAKGSVVRAIFVVALGCRFNQISGCRTEVRNREVRSEPLQGVSSKRLNRR